MTARIPRLDTIGTAIVVEDGVVFETGRPVEFDYVRGTVPAPNFGARFQQDIEPAGRYMVHVDRRNWGDPLPGQERGTHRFNRPLVLAFTLDPETLYGPTSWKARLRELFKAKGKALSRKLAAAGYDGIVTVWLVRGVGSHTKEIVDLTMFTHKQNPVDTIRDESFEWVHPAVRGEIDAAVDRALGSGATPPLSYAGAGQYGIVICDATGKAYKVARGEKGRWADRPSAQSLRDEEAWFRFAAKLPAIRSHVAKVYGYDDDNDVLVRECVQAVEDRRPDYSGKRSERLRQLYTLISDSMREYGFRRPEFKEDSFVMHPKRGLVLVDAGFGSRDIGWANARRAQDLLRGDKPRNDWEIGSVVHGLRMDAGDEVPADIANKLADRLETTYMQNPTAAKPRLRIVPSTYRGHQGFLVTGTDGYGRQIRVFAKTRKGAEAIRSAYKDIVDQNDRFAEVNRILLAAKDNPVRTPTYSYHVTFYNRLETIANRGLVPVESMRPGASSLGRGGYAGGSAGKVFLTERAGVDFWYDRAELAAHDMSDDPLTEGFVPVVLRTPSPKGKRKDEAGSADSTFKAWYVKQKIPAGAIEVWDGGGWLPVGEWREVDVLQAVEMHLDGDDYSFRVANPLSAIDPGPARRTARITDRLLPGYSR